MPRIVWRDPNSLRNIKLHMIKLKSNFSDGSQFCWYSWYFELLRAKRTPNGAMKLREACIGTATNGALWCS